MSVQSLITRAATNKFRAEGRVRHFRYLASLAAPHQRDYYLSLAATYEQIGRSQQYVSGLLSERLGQASNEAPSGCRLGESSTQSLDAYTESIDLAEVMTLKTGAESRANSRVYEGKDFVESMRSRTVSFAPGEAIVKVGGAMSYIYLITSGWACRSWTLPNGIRRIVYYHLPGDLICLDACRYKESIRDWHSITRVEARAIIPADFLDALNEGVVPACRLLEYYAREMAQIGEHLAAGGGRNAVESITFLCLELWHRLRPLGMTTGNGCLFPISGKMIAETIGLTDEHVSRCLQQLRKEGVLEISRCSSRKLEILSMDRAVALSGFDPAMLRL